MSSPRKDAENDLNLVFKDRTFERRQGCWNCKHWNNGALSIGKWNVNRQRDLEAAARISLNHPAGENAQEVINIRAMVDSLDHSIAKGEFGVCIAGKSETDFCHHAYLCDGWTGAEGASIARDGAALDKLPEELKDIVGD